MKPTKITTALRQPLSARFGVRRSTALMAVLFLGLGALWLQVKTPSTSASASTAKALGQVLNGLPPGGSITITRPRTTTTTTTTSTTTAPANTSTTAATPRTTTTTTRAPSGGRTTVTTEGSATTTSSTTIGSPSTG